MCKSIVTIYARMYVQLVACTVASCIHAYLATIVHDLFKNCHTLRIESTLKNTAQDLTLPTTKILLLAAEHLSLLVYHNANLQATLQSLATEHSRFFVANDNAHQEMGVVLC